MHFRYIAKNKSGLQSSGELSGDSAEHVASKLAELDLIPIKIDEIEDKPANIANNGVIFTYSFTGRDRTGKTVSGTIDAQDQDIAYRRLHYEFELSNIYIRSITNKRSHLEQFQLELKSFLDWLTFIYIFYYFVAFLLIRFDIRLNFLPRDFLVATTTSYLFFYFVSFISIAFFTTEIPRWWRLLKHIDDWASGIYISILPFNAMLMFSFLYTLITNNKIWQDTLIWPLLPCFVILFISRKSLKP